MLNVSYRMTQFFLFKEMFVQFFTLQICINSFTHFQIQKHSLNIQQAYSLYQCYDWHDTFCGFYPNFFENIRKIRYLSVSVWMGKILVVFIKHNNKCKLPGDTSKGSSPSQRILFLAIHPIFSVRRFVSLIQISKSIDATISETFVVQSHRK